jgi:hypothetical protein
MTRTEVRTFIKEGVQAIAPDLSFGTGLYTFFNSNRSWKYPLVFQETVPIGVTSTSIEYQAPTDDWDIVLWISQQGAVDMIPEDYEPLIDQCDYIAQKLMYQYRNVIQGYKLVTLNSVSRTPFVKVNADCLAGVTLRFKINSPDKTVVC